MKQFNQIIKSVKPIMVFRLFSPSAVNGFCNNSISEGTIVLAIDKTTANAVKQFCANEIVISEFPG